jgi:hypothetical protein
MRANTPNPNHIGTHTRTGNTLAPAPPPEPPCATGLACCWCSKGITHQSEMSNCICGIARKRGNKTHIHKSQPNRHAYPYRQRARISATSGTTVHNWIVLLLVCKRGHSSVRDEQAHLRNSKKKVETNTHPQFPSRPIRKPSPRPFHHSTTLPTPLLSLHIKPERQTGCPHIQC